MEVRTRRFRACSDIEALMHTTISGLHWRQVGNAAFWLPRSKANRPRKVELLREWRRYHPRTAVQGCPRRKQESCSTTLGSAWMSLRVRCVEACAQPVCLSQIDPHTKAVLV